MIIYMLKAQLSHGQSTGSQPQGNFKAKTAPVAAVLTDTSRWSVTSPYRNQIMPQIPTVKDCLMVQPSCAALMTSTATCGTMALPYPRSRPTREDTPSASGNVPDSTGRHLPSLHQSQSESSHPASNELARSDLSLALSPLLGSVP